MTTELKPLYVPSFVEFAAADITLNSLLALPWLQVTAARREYFMSDVPRSYAYGSGVGRRSYDSAPYTDRVKMIQDWINVYYGPAHNVCFLNRYDEQKHQLGWHADDDATMDRDHPIAVLSFGAEREIWWRKKGDKGETPPERRQLLQHGSLFVMPARFQDGYEHRIPKSDRACGVRVSLTFRRYTSEPKEQSHAEEDA